MSTDRIAVIDIETTGLYPMRHDRVIEIAIVVVSPDGEVLSEYETLVNPCRDIGASTIHQISAGDVLRAPSFADVAGDVLAVLADVQAVAGHNVSFDRRFLTKEYERLNAALPEFPLLCTCRLFGRSSLQECCDELGISFDGVPHRALSDARTTARIVSSLCADDPSTLDACRLHDVPWPRLAALDTPRFCREHAQQAQLEPPHFLRRLAARLHHDVEAHEPQLLAYMTLIDRVLDDRVIDESEDDVLVESAVEWGLSLEQVHKAHTHYIHALAVAALADGVVTESERRDLRLVARLLGHDDAVLDAILDSAFAQLTAAQGKQSSLPREDTLRGKSVCFTGELQATIGGQPVSREVAESLAAEAGLTIASNVTKKLDLLVVADPNTQSGKAKKARQYGIRVLSDAVFWGMAGITVD